MPIIRCYEAKAICTLTNSIITAFQNYLHGTSAHNLVGLHQTKRIVTH
jgi:hypothetical protein